MYTCMALDMGRFQWEKVDVFQKKLGFIYIGLPRVIRIADDMIVCERNETEHSRDFILFLENIKINGLCLNKENLQFKCQEVSFFRHT